MRIAPFAALVLPALLVACASDLHNPLTGGFFADAGKYEYFSCEQIAGQRQGAKAREQELKQLMDKAEKGTGGAVVSVIAYQTDYTMVQDELRVLDATARNKKCPTAKIGAAIPLSGEVIITPVGQHPRETVV
jgi:hypothetical protein